MSEEEIKALLIIWETFNNGVDSTIDNRDKINEKINQFLEHEYVMERINQNKEDDTKS